MNKFIVFEGLDKSGKSKHAKMLAEHFENFGKKVLYLDEEFDCRVTKETKKLITKHKEELNSLQKFLLTCAILQSQILEVIQPALKEGKIVITKNFHGHTLANFCYGEYLYFQFAYNAIKEIILGCRPGLIIFLDIPVDVSLNKLKRKNAKNLEIKTDAFYQRVQSGLFEISKLENWVNIDANHEIETVHKKILDLLFIKNNM